MTQLEGLLRLERPILFFDTETTGPNAATDRIVELGLIQLRPDGTTYQWQHLINPTVPIPAAATYGTGDDRYPGHGITDEMVADKPTFAILAPYLLRGFRDCDYGGFNVKRYDLPLLQKEFERAGHAWSYADARVIDGHRLWQLGIPRTLSDAVEEFLQRKHDGAHRTISDVRASMDVVAAQFERFLKLPRDVQALHDLQWPRDPNWIDPDGKLAWIDGVACVNFGKKWNGQPLHRVSRDYFQWMLSAEFSPEVKRLVADILQGRFPERPPSTEEVAS